MTPASFPAVRPSRAAIVPAPARPVRVQATIAATVDVAVEHPADAGARESLLDRAFGSGRFAKTCERLRAGRLPAAGLALVARTSRTGGGEVTDRAPGDLVGTVRLWHVAAGATPALMLGPLAVDAGWRCHGVGARLMDEAIARARALGHRAILLVGDAPYYERFGFARCHTPGLRLPGPVEAERFLGLELVVGALAGARGPVRATGAIDLTRDSTRDLTPDLAGRQRRERSKRRHAA